MSFLKKATGSVGGSDGGPWPRPVENALELIEYYEGNRQHKQAVRVRLWNGMPQREAHRPIVEEWLRSGVAFENPPPPVPRWVQRGEPIEETEDRRMDRAMRRFKDNNLTQQLVNGWPPKWRKVAQALGYLDDNGQLRQC